MTETQLAEATFDATRVARFLRSPAGELRVALVNVATGAEFGSLPLANASREELARVMGIVGAMRARLASAPVVASSEGQAGPSAAQETPAEWRRRVLGKSVWFRFGPRRVTVVLNGPRGDKSELVSRKREAAEAMEAIVRVATGHGGVVLPPRTITKATEEVEIFVTSLPPDAVESFVRGVTGGLGAMGFKVFAEPGEVPPERVSASAPPPTPVPAAQPRAARPVPFAQRFGASAPEPVRPRVVFTRSRFGAGAPEPLRPLPAPPPPTEAQKAASAPIGAVMQSNDVPNVDIKTTGAKWSPYQRAVFKWIAAGTRNIVIRAVAGSGKCLGKGTPVMLADGRVVPVESVVTGDRLMGPDSKPREVLSTNVGRGPLFRIDPVKGDSWVCNDVHVMTLAGTNRHMGEVIDIPLNDLIERTERRGTRIDRDWKLWRASVEFPPREVPVDPYLVGLWIGDGTEGEAIITNGEPEVRDFCRGVAAAHGVEVVESRVERNNTWTLRFRVGERGGSHRAAPNPLRRFFRERCSLSGGGKIIPDEYLRNESNVRLALLAGILDTDGYTEDGTCYEVTTVSEVLRDQIIYLARSLGFGAYSTEKTSTIRSIGFSGIYQRITLSGDIDRIPLRVERRKGVPRRQIKRVGCTGFEAVPIGEGDYYGFTLDGDGRFLLGDFTVTHNTTTIMQSLAEIAPSDSVLMVAFNKTIQKQLAAKLPKGMDNVMVSTLAAWGYVILRRYWRGTEMLSRKGLGGDVCDKARDEHVFNVGLGADKEGLKWRGMTQQDRDSYYRLLGDIEKLMGLCESYLAMTPDAIRAVEKDYDLFGDEFWWQGERKRYTNEDVIRWVLTAQRERLTQPPAGVAYARDTVLDSNRLRNFVGIYDELTDKGQKSFCSFRDMSFVVAATATMEPPKKFARVYVDETQDMDVAQTTIVLRSVEQPNGRVIVVGDEDQAIYRFRGADSDSMKRLAGVLNAVELPLSVSYRVPVCAAQEAQTVVPSFSVPERTLTGEPWPQGSCERLQAKQMARMWREGDIVITRVNDTLMPMAMLALSNGITPLIMGEGSSVARQVSQTFDQIIKTHGLTYDAPIDRFHPSLVAYYEKAEAKIVDGIRRYILGKEADFEKDQKTWERKGRRGQQPRKWWVPSSARNLSYEGQIDAAVDQILSNSTDAANLQLVFNAFWTPEGSGLSQRPGFKTIGDINEVVSRLAPSEKAVEEMSPEEYKELMAHRLVLTSVHRIKGGEAARVFVLLETFSFAFNRWQKRAPQSPKAQREEKNLWYVAVTRVLAEPGNPESGKLYYVSGLRELLGKNNKWQVDEQ